MNVKEKKLKPHMINTEFPRLLFAIFKWEKLLKIISASVPIY